MVQPKHRPLLGLAIFFTLVVAASGVFEWLLISKADPIEEHLQLALLLMWTPAIASIVARLVLWEGLRDVSFRFGGWLGARELLRAWVFPVVVGSAAYGIAWSAGLAGFQIHAAMFLPPPSSPVVSVAQLLLIQLTVNTLINVIAVAGEEIGWRGYMLTRLIETGVPNPILVSGLIWAAWHVPMIVGGVYSSSDFPLISAAVFTVSIVGQGMVLAHVRLASGSIWPAVIGHAAWNAVMQGVFDRSTTIQTGVNWVGEDGLVVAAICIFLAVIFTLGRKQTLLAPGLPLSAPAKA